MDWIDRIKNKAFWIAIIPALFLLTQQVAAIFGYTLDLTTLQEQTLAIINTVFVLLAILGVVVDPTTPGITDAVYIPLDDEIDGYALYDDEDEFNDELEIVEGAHVKPQEE